MIKEYYSLTRPQIVDIVNKGRAVAVLPIGAVEQHGPHLPVGTDSYTAAYYARESLSKCKVDADFLILPQLYYALSVEHINYPGTIALTPETLLHVIVEIAQGLKFTGFKNLVIFNGHGGNDHILQIAAREVRKMGMNVCASCSIAIMDSMGIDPSAVHADKVETSMMYVLHPELVDKDKITEELDKSVEKWMALGDMKVHISETWFAEDVSVDGVIGEPTKASPEFGVEFLKTLTDEMAKGVDYVVGKNLE